LPRLSEHEAGELLGSLGPNGPCPPIDRLSRLVTGDLDSEARQTLVDHLASCSACRADVRAALATADWAAQLSAVLDRPSDRPSDGPIGAPAPASRPNRRWPWLAATGVGVAAAVAAAAWAWRTQSERANLFQELAIANALAARVPALEAELAGRSRELAAIDAEQRTASPAVVLDLRRSDPGIAERPADLTLAAETRLVTFVVGTPAAGDALVVDLVDAAEAAIGRWSGLCAGAAGRCAFTVATSALPAGTVRLRVFRDSQSATPLVEYPIAVGRR
jgi:hypothetical protein